MELLHWLAYLGMVLAALPLAMALESDDDDPGGGQDLDDPEDPPEPKNDEPFFSLNDRTVYKTADDLKEAHRRANEVIENYRKYGSPEDLAALRAKAEEADRFRKAVAGDEPKKTSQPDPYEGMSPEDRKRWDSSMGVTEKVLKSKGYLTREEAEALADERAERRYSELRFRENCFGHAKEVVGKFAQLIPEFAEADAARIVGVISRAVENTNDPELIKQWNAGNHTAFVEKALETVYPAGFIKRALAGKPAPAADPQPSERDDSGRFVSRRERRFADAKANTKKLPAAGTGAGAPAAAGSDPGERRNLHRKPGSIARIMKEKFGVGAEA